jgi:hypothetical protein
MEKKRELYKRFEELAKERYPITVKEFYNSTMNLMDMAYNLDRESPPVTADVDEAAKEFQKSNPLAKTLLTDYFIAGVQWQKQQMAVTGTAEEMYFDALDDWFKEIHQSIHQQVKAKGWKNFYYAVLRYQSEQVQSGYKLIDSVSNDYKRSICTQSTTIERLTKALEGIIKFADLEQGAIVSKIAHEALAIKK